MSEEVKVVKTKKRIGRVRRKERIGIIIPIEEPEDADKG